MAHRTQLAALNRVSPSLRPLLMAGALGIYLLAHISLRSTLEAGIATLSAIPVIAAAWLWGMRTGAVAGFLSFPLNTLLLATWDPHSGGWDAVIQAGGLPGSLILVLIGAAFGRLHDVQNSLRWRLDELDRMGRALRDREARLHLLVEQVPAVLWTTDDQLRFTSSAGAGLVHLGLQPDQVVGQSLYQYFGTEDPEFAAVAAHRRALRGESVSYELTWRDRTYQVHVQPLRAGTGATAGTIGVALDITERKRAEEALRARDALLDAQVRELGAISEVSAALRGAESMNGLASAIVTQARELLGGDAAFLHLLDEEQRQIMVVGATGADPSAMGRRHDREEGITGLVLRTGQTFHTGDLAGDPRVVHRDLVQGLGEAICVPLRTSTGQTVGTLTVARGLHSTSQGGLATQEHRRLLYTLAEIAGNAVQRVRAHETLEEAYIQAVLALSNAMDARDTYTAHHSRRLATFAVATERALGCGGEEVQYIRWGALLHDLGKLAVPDAILRKEGRLTPQEWAMIRCHPDVGARIVAPVHRFRPVLPIIRHHHEHWDGSGYPAGLAGEAIPLGARILAIADAYVAMTEDRIYRKARSRHAAMAEIRRHAGTQFDPQIIPVFCQVVARELSAEAHRCGQSRRRTKIRSA